MWISKGPALSALPLERTAIFQEEYERLSAQHIKDKEARKKNAEAKSRPSGTKIRKKSEKKAAAAGGS